VMAVDAACYCDARASRPPQEQGVADWRARGGASKGLRPDTHASWYEVKAVTAVRLGLRENLAQFSCSSWSTLCGAMVAWSAPSCADRRAGIPPGSEVRVLSFIVVSASRRRLPITAGRLSDRFGRKHVLVPAGSSRRCAVPADVGADMVVVLAANALLGVSQALPGHDGLMKD